MSGATMGEDRRDLFGYGGKPPKVGWPGGAKVAVSFVINNEEGGEYAVGDGDHRNELVHEAIDDVGPLPDLCTESHFAYGTRAAWWRIAGVFDRFGAKPTVSSCGRAVERSPWLAQDAVARGYEVSCHGWRWERHAGMEEAAEREAIARTYDTIAEVCGVPPVGWHTRSASSLDTRRLLVEHGGFLYDSDAYDDDLPYFKMVAGRRHLVLPYAFDTNDMRFRPGSAFVSGDDFSSYVLAAFDWLAGEADEAPRMMSVGLHLRTIGRPARIGGLQAILQGLAERGTGWIARRDEIARHWIANAPGG
ncbi:polysaccharide deacetylase family protein [Acuticoccus sp. I52.16.1]|uniref:polysaccharide deacetylase family protein n=1 Tax=Acuticoccus sp. I52.16.1 TaxID=2928472 RepID=UPI001FD0786F|nr:polysaccharide deacetylase family protein [Acuticoccus sp. I52.16.1]UOM36044.1 polysaccharide deacetylase family protein [Acuticoccus sp. I52.16.1]